MATVSEGHHSLGEEGIIGSERALATAEPTGVLLGFGSDPLALGAAAFAMGGLAAGMLFIGVFPAAVGGVLAPIVMCISGLALFLTTIWGIFVGQTMLAGVFGIVAGVFFCLGILTLGLTHNWFGIPPADIPKAQAVFYIVIACYFFFLIPPFMTLPPVYPLAALLIVVAFALSAYVALNGGPVSLGKAAGYVILFVVLLLFGILTNSNTAAVGMKPFPPLGKPLVTPPAQQ